MQAQVGLQHEVCSWRILGLSSSLAPVQWRPQSPEAAAETGLNRRTVTASARVGAKIDLRYGDHWLLTRIHRSWDSRGTDGLLPLLANLATIQSSPTGGHGACSLGRGSICSQGSDVLSCPATLPSLDWMPRACMLCTVLRFWKLPSSRTFNLAMAAMRRRIAGRPMSHSWHSTQGCRFNLVRHRKGDVPLRYRFKPTGVRNEG